MIWYSKSLRREGYLNLDLEFHLPLELSRAPFVRLIMQTHLAVDTIDQ